MAIRGKHSLSNFHDLTCDMGLLIPINTFEALPGDSMRISSSAMVRLKPMLAPVFHPMVCKIHHWFVPNRLIWEDWEDFITGGEDGLNASEWPHLTTGQIVESSLADYMSVPVGDFTDLKYSALPARAYALIFNEMYRDQQLVPEVSLSKSSGNDVETNLALLRCAWEKDYFTTCRTEETLGEAVTIPLGEKAPITGLGSAGQTFDFSDQTAFEAGGTSRQYATARFTSSANPADLLAEQDPDHPGYPGIYADLSQATGISINDLRLALAIQRYQEARNNYGARYVEYLRYLGVRSSDARLGNPEFLGGGRGLVQISEVLQTASDEIGQEQSPVGTMRGHGIMGLRTRPLRRFFEEHGVVISLMSVVPKAMYTSGLWKMWHRETKEQYYQKELVHLGDQAVLNEEIQAMHTSPNEIFGFQNRYDEYRSVPSQISGEFNSDLDYWHLGRFFTGDVALNQSFIDANPSKRIFADTEGHSLKVMVKNSVQARRLLPRTVRARTF